MYLQEDEICIPFMSNKQILQNHCGKQNNEAIDQQKK